MIKCIYNRYAVDRNLSKDLAEWHSNKRRKSLILRGARQVGKTWLVRNFAVKHNLDLIEINFERKPKWKAIFQESLDPWEIITEIEIEINRKFTESALIFFDEVQDCPRALTALKHFTDSDCDFPVIAAGSYLGMVEDSLGTSQPIGYVDELTLFPMCFDEFVGAGSHHLALLEPFHDISKLKPTLHEKLLSLYRDYLYTGGMPEVVGRWTETESKIDGIHQCREIQKALLSKYKADFSKYRPREALNICRTWKIIAEQLSRSFESVSRFQFKGQISGKKDYKGFANYFQQLEACGLIYRSYVLKNPQYPLKSSKKESLFKCFFFDTGLLLAELDFEYKALDGSTDIIFKGAIAENFIAGELSRHSIGLFTYVKDNSTAEIEFLAQKDGRIIPIEVKNNNTAAKSLTWFMKTFEPEVALKVSNNIGSVTGVVRHYPTYLCGLALKDLSLTSTIQ